MICVVTGQETNSLTKNVPLSNEGREILKRIRPLFDAQERDKLKTVLSSRIESDDKLTDEEKGERLLRVDEFVNTITKGGTSIKQALILAKTRSNEDFNKLLEQK